MISFEGKLVDIVMVADTPAVIADQLGAVLGCERRSLSELVTWEWANEFEEDRDYAVLRGDGLADVKAWVPGLRQDTTELIVLFERGVQLALSRVPHRVGTAQREFVVDEVLPTLRERFAQTALSRAVQRIKKVTDSARSRSDLEDRKFRVDELRYATTVLHEAGYLDNAGWAACVARMCEIAIGEPMPALSAVRLTDWVSAEELGDRYAVAGEAVVDVAMRLGLTDRPLESLPVPLRGATGWTVSFRFSPKAATLIEAWLESPDPGSESRVA